jgi:hypothetical protein
VSAATNEEHPVARSGPGRIDRLGYRQVPGDNQALWAFAVINGFVLVVCTVMLVQEWRVHDWPQVVIFGCFLSIVVPSLFLVLRLASTSAFVTDRFVSTPRLWGRRVISLVEVTGVGLRYVPGQRYFTWRLKVWPNDDDSRWADNSVVVDVKQMKRGEPRGLSNRTGFRKRLRARWDYVPVLDWDYLAQAPQGKAATAIYSQAFAVQGPHGLLATHARQCTARSPGASETAYWSPDGGIGAIRNGEPEGPQ